MNVKFRESALDTLGKYVADLILDDRNVESIIKRLEAITLPLEKSANRYPFAASGGQWWVEKFFSLKLRVFFKISGNVLVVTHVDMRDFNTYADAEIAWKAKP
jgi:hypothetical protein